MNKEKIIETGTMKEDNGQMQYIGQLGEKYILHQQTNYKKLMNQFHLNNQHKINL